MTTHETSTEKESTMTQPNHRAAAEAVLHDLIANAYGGPPAIARMGILHALLAIHDLLAELRDEDHAPLWMDDRDGLHLPGDAEDDLEDTVPRPVYVPFGALPAAGPDSLTRLVNDAFRQGGAA